jgi:Signal transduction histidine kinase
MLINKSLDKPDLILLDLDRISVERLFDRFYTVGTGRNSTGLGLSIAKYLTERMGGNILAAYRNGKLVITLEFYAHGHFKEEY